MSRTNDESTADDRFASGEWVGFYLQPNGNHRYPMELVLRFQEAQISGEGADVVGEFTIEGVFDVKSGDCSWTKQYLGQHAVQYQGRSSHRGIVGGWTMSHSPPDWCGPFFIWPRVCGDLESLFERAFVEYEWRSISFDVPVKALAD